MPAREARAHGGNGSGGRHRIAKELEGGEVGEAVEPHRDPPQVVVVEPQLRGVARVSATESHALCILFSKSCGTLLPHNPTSVSAISCVSSGMRPILHARAHQRTRCTRGAVADCI